MIRETLISTENATEIAKIPAREQPFINKFGTVFTTEKIMELFPKLDEAQYHIERNANPKILFMDLSLSIGQIART